MMECEWLIIGAGPAGCTAAMTLKELGVDDVVVIDRLSPEAHARYHSICGEAVSDRMFDRIGYHPDCILKRVSSISIDFPGNASISIPVDGSIVDRNAMMTDLRSRSNAEFVRTTVLSVRREGDGFIVETNSGQYRCRYLVGADGACSVVRRDIFGYKPEKVIPIINNIVPGDGGDVLRFIVSSKYSGGYKWEFPSSEGLMSVGYPKGTDYIVDPVSTGARNMPIGKPPSVVKDNCCIIGDAACLANPLCFGGIGTAMLSARKAIRAMNRGTPQEYDRWVRKDRMFSDRFMRAHRTFVEWDDEDIADAMEPFRGKQYSVFRGLISILRRPRWGNVYLCCWAGFSKGW